MQADKNYFRSTMIGIMNKLFKIKITETLTRSSQTLVKETQDKESNFNTVNLGVQCKSLSE